MHIIVTRSPSLSILIFQVYFYQGEFAISWSSMFILFERRGQFLFIYNIHVQLIAYSTRWQHYAQLEMKI